jgi:MFS family permease
MLSPLVTDALGRRSTFFLAALGFIGGIAVMATATSFEILLIARAVVGIGVGIGEAIDPMYISEISPPSHRGFLVSWAEAGVAVGVVLGFTSSLIFWNMDHASDVKWRCMLALGAVLPCVMLVLIWKVMPESPRWLLCKGKREQAKGILQTLYPPHVDIDHVVETIEESLATEQAASQTVGWTSLLCRPSPAIRRMLTVGIGIAIIQQAVGIDSVMFYLVYVIKNAGIQSELGQTLALIVLGIVKLVFVFVGAELFDKVGRRIMLFISLMGTLVGNMSIAVSVCCANMTLTP